MTINMPMLPADPPDARLCDQHKHPETGASYAASAAPEGAASSVINRRKLLMSAVASASVLPLVANAPAANAASLSPTIAPAIEVDPVFAAIDRHRKVMAKLHRLWRRLEEVEAAAREELGFQPCELIAWRRYSRVGRGGIESARAEFLRFEVAAPEVIEHEYQDALARFRAEVRAGKKWDRRAGLVQLRAQDSRLRKEARQAEAALAATHSTTPAGAAALIKYAADDVKHEFHGLWALPVFRAAAKALSRMDAGGVA